MHRDGVIATLRGRLRRAREQAKACRTPEHEPENATPACGCDKIPKHERP
jgi:hypothetical protein